MTEGESVYSRKKTHRSNKKNNNSESDGVTEEAESKINTDLSLLDKVFKESIKRMNETHKEAIIDHPEIETGTDENVTLEFDKENHDPGIKLEEKRENPEKRIKTENNKKMSKLKSQDKKTSVDIVKRCDYCNQKLDDDIKMYQGHPNGAVEEEIALIDPRLCLFIGDESFN